MAVKDLGEVDNDYFLIPVGIRDHEGGLRASFPVENRLLPQGVSLCILTQHKQHDVMPNALHECLKRSVSINLSN